jgi:adenylate kinase family enzyme
MVSRQNQSITIGLVRRVLIVGAPGVGKSTTARLVASRLGISYVELDALFHGPDWTARPTFRDDVAAVAVTEAWVIDGNYSEVRDILWAAADTIVWLDLPRLLTEWQVVVRTARRVLLRTPLWSGNREQWRHVGRMSHPIRWSWLIHGRYRVQYAARFADPAFAAKTRLRLQSRREIRAWTDELDTCAAPPP